MKEHFRFLVLMIVAILFSALGFGWGYTSCSIDVMNSLDKLQIQNLEINIPLNTTQIVEDIANYQKSSSSESEEKRE